MGRKRKRLDQRETAVRPAPPLPPSPPAPPAPPGRSPWILPATAVAVLLLVAAIFWFPRRTAGPAFPVTPEQNVLLITIDTLRADALGSYGGRAATPNLDRLASEGLRFTFAHAHAVMTLPSHASIMTGRYPFDHGVRDNAGFRLPDSTFTIAEAAKNKGFATAAFVGAFPLDRQFGLAQGFEVYEDVGGRQVEQGELSLTERRAQDVVQRARTWMDQQTTPWFAWVHVFDPHAPYAPPPPFDGTYASDRYAGEVAYVDHALGPLLEPLRGRPRPTTVLVTSDHGEGLGDHGERTHGTFAYESTLRVPLIMATVGGGNPERRGAVSDAAVQHTDIFPTVIALLGLDRPEGLRGRSLTEAFDGDAAATYFEAMSPMLTRGWAPLRGLIRGREKFIELPVEELYELSVDPLEQQNVAARAPDRLRGAVEALRALKPSLPGDQSAAAPDARERLLSLGYLSGAAPRKAHYTEADDPKRLIELDRMMLDALELHAARQHDDAARRFREIVTARPDMTAVYRRLAAVQWDARRSADAIATLRETLARNGPDHETEVRLGTYLAEAGEPAEAVVLLERVNNAASDNSEALNALGIAYARAGKTSAALETLERALLANPRDVFASENIGAIHLDSGNLTAAAAAFRRAAAVDPRSSRAEAGLGIVARRQGRSEEAIAHWRRAVELDPTNFDALFNLAQELATAGRLSEARPYLTQFVQTAPVSYAQEIARFQQILGR